MKKLNKTSVLLSLLFWISCSVVSQVNHQKVGKMALEKIKEIQGSDLKSFKKDLLTASSMNRIYNENINLMNEETKKLLRTWGEITDVKLNNYIAEEYIELKEAFIKYDLDPEELEYVDYLPEEFDLGCEWDAGSPGNNIVAIGGFLYFKHKNKKYKVEIGVVCTERKWLPGYSYKYCVFEDIREL